VNLNEFVLEAAGHGACVGVHAEISSPLVPPVTVQVRTVDGTHTKTLDTLFDAFAEVWHFPPRFAQHHNKDAFNDWMRDFDNLTNPALDKPPATGYLTDIIDAHLLLIDQPGAFPWFANKMPRYRDYYRDEADPPAAFGLLLSAPADQLDDVRERWLAVGIQIAQVTI
jgi:Barstar (barnase inhibitor)